MHRSNSKTSHHPSFGRATRSAHMAAATTLLAALLGAGCRAPEFSGPDQVADINVATTALKDNRFESMSWTDLDAAIIDALVPNPDTEPGCAVGVVRDGEIIYLQGYGYAQLPGGGSPGRRWGVSTMGALGSISKTITAAALLSMVDDGDLALGDLVADDLATSNPSLGEQSLESLLNHTSGIGGATQAAAFAPDFSVGSDARDCRDDPNGQPAGFCAGVSAALASPLAAFAQYQANESVALPPPTGGSLTTGVYSNVGFSVAGAVIDAVAPSVSSSDGYEQYVWNELGQWSGNALEGGHMHSLALTHSWRDTDIPNRAIGYGNPPGFPVFEAWNETDGIEGWEGPAGGWAMTIGDLSRFLIALNESEFFDDPTLLGQMRETHTDFSGMAPHYAMGMFTGNGTIAEADYHHGGDIGGHHAYWAWWEGYQGHEIGIGLACNRDDLNSNTLYGAMTWQSGEQTEDSLLWIVANQNPDPPSDLTFAAIVEEEVQGATFEIDAEKAWLVGGQDLALPLILTDLDLMLVVDDFDEASGAPLFLFGEAETDPGQTPQLKSPVTLRSASYRNPDFRTWPVSMTIGWNGWPVSLEQMVLEGAFGEGGKSVEALSMTALLDLRQGGPLGYEPTGQAACRDVRLAGGECVPCADGEAVCVSVRYEGLAGVPVPEPGFAGAFIVGAGFLMALRRSRPRRG